MCLAILIIFHNNVVCEIDLEYSYQNKHKMYSKYMLVYAEKTYCEK